MQRTFKVLMILTARTSWDDANRNSTRSSHKDLHEIMPGHREDFTRTSSRADHKDLWKIMRGLLTAFD